MSSTAEFGERGVSFVAKVIQFTHCFRSGKRNRTIDKFQADLTELQIANNTRSAPSRTICEDDPSISHAVRRIKFEPQTRMASRTGFLVGNDVRDVRVCSACRRGARSAEADAKVRLVAPSVRSIPIIMKLQPSEFNRAEGA